MEGVKFKLKSPLRPTGDQPQAIEALCRGVLAGKDRQVLLGVTGSGKTFTIANVIAALNRPALVMAPNKTLAAQLYSEFKNLFPDNAVEYFVSYYDYYQPEAYLPATDTFIEKDASINDKIDKLRHSTTRSLMERRDVIVVASVSCIYGLGSPERYRDMLVFFEREEEFGRDDLLAKLVEIQYERGDYDFHRGSFRVRGETVEIFPPYEEDVAYRIVFCFDRIESIVEIDPISGAVRRKLSKLALFPASHYVTSENVMSRAIKEIRNELAVRLEELKRAGKELEARRLKQRTEYDIGLMEEMGFCPGIENYSRFLDGRKPGEPPYTLLDYFPDDYLLIIDESHITVPQIRGMYNGDRSRKEVLVEHGFRLPSALDNRPLCFDEFEERMKQVIFVSATPGPYELRAAEGDVVEQIIRPTGLLDPVVHVRPVEGQIDDLLSEIHSRIKIGDRVLVTTLTKRMAEDLTTFFKDRRIECRYMHSDIDTIERQKLLRGLRKGEFDVLVGINLLREGLDLPEVSLVAVLDADKEGFLRSAGSLIQICGRAARNERGTVVFYADKITPAMDEAIRETKRRRNIQEEYNKKHGIVPRSIIKAVDDPIARLAEADYVDIPVTEDKWEDMSVEKLEAEMERTRKKMLKAASSMEFELAAKLRDKLRSMEKHLLLRR